MALEAFTSAAERPLSSAALRVAALRKAAAAMANLFINSPPAGLCLLY
jgi:hypothetical protein